MADTKDIWVYESPKVLAMNEGRTYTMDFANVGTPSSPTMIAYDASGTDKSSDVLSGSMSVNGTIVGMKKFTPNAAGNWRLIVTVTINADTVKGALDVAVFSPVPVVSVPATGSYGTVAGVSSLVPKFINKAGTFDDTTRPTLAQVSGYIEQLSSMINVMLAAQGFSTPITDVDVTPGLRLFVEQEVAAIVEGINGSGRFGPRVGERSSGRKSRLQLILDDVKDFIEMFAIGLERLGASKSGVSGGQILYRGTDESGDTVTPIFQREAFGNKYDLWDS